MKILNDDKNQWEVLYFKIKEKILNKELLSGQKLESQNILSKKNNISRYSVRKAIQKLENENIIISHQGKGSFITKNIYRVHLSKNSRFHLNALLEKRDSSTIFLKSKIIKPPIFVQNLLEAKDFKKIIMCELLRKIDGSVVSISRHYFIREKFPDIEKRIKKFLSITLALKSLGVHEFHRSKTYLSTRLPDAYERRIIKISKLMPLLISTGLDIDKDGNKIQISVSLMRGDLSEFSIIHQ